MSRACMLLSRLPQLASASRGHCGLVSAPRAHPPHRVYVYKPHPGFMCSCFLSLPALFVAGAICSSFGCARRFVCAARFACLPSSGTPSRPLRKLCLLPRTRLPGAPSVLQWLCAMAESVCLPLSVPEPAVFGPHVQERLTGWEGRCSVYRPLSLCFAWFSRTSQLPLGLPVRELPCVLELVFQGSLSPWGHKLLPRSPPIFPSLCLPLSLLSPTSFQGA